MILQEEIKTSNLFHVEIKHKNIYNVMKICENCGITLYYLIKIVIEVMLWKFYVIHVICVMT